MVLAARKQGLHSVLLPAANAREAALVPGIRLLPADTLSRALEAMRTGVGQEIPEGGEVMSTGDLEPDYGEIKGQSQAKRALEVAAAGGHNFLMAGSPGCGKTLMARRLPSILPPLSDEEGLEATRIYSVAGLLRHGHGIMRQRPFRSPHHSISDQALVGGGKIPRPGEVSLAHLGVLFLDELPEFRKSTLETLRQPLEDGSVTIARTAHTVTYPSR
jgi:magnesium chelatase family protein